MLRKTKRLLRTRRQSLKFWIQQLFSRAPHRQLAIAWLDHLRVNRGVNFPLLGLTHHSPRLLPHRKPYHSPPVISMVGLPTISIVTPSFNQASMLERTIRSVLDQNYPKLQYVVQDGGSSDRSIEIIRRYAPQLYDWDSRPDEGQAHAIQLGFEKTDGQVMGWLNSDDVLMPGALWEIARFFQNSPRTDVAYGHRLIIDEHDRQVGQWVLPANTHKYLRWADYLAQESVYWTRDIWDRVNGLDRSFQFAMDWDLFLRFQRAGAQFRRIPKTIGGFRLHAAQKTSMRIDDLGEREMRRLRHRELGHIPEHRELSRKLVWLYWRNYAIATAQRAGLYKVA